MTASRRMLWPDIHRFIDDDVRLLHVVTAHRMQHDTPARVPWQRLRR